MYYSRKNYDMMAEVLNMACIEYINIKFAITFVSFKKETEHECFFKNIKNIMVFGTVHFYKTPQF